MEEISLKQFGLTGAEEKVYLRLLELGSVPAGELIKKTGLHRAAVYDNIALLSEKGLVSYVIKANRKYFFAEEPERFGEVLEREKDRIAQAQQSLARLIPKLKVKRSLSRQDQEASVYEGPKGMKSIAEDVLKTRGEILVFGATGRFMETMGPYAWNWHRRREELGIKLKVIFNEKVVRAKKKLQIGLWEIKSLPRDYEAQATTWVFGDKTAILIWSEDPVGFVIRNTSVADANRKFFEILWMKARA